MTDPKEKAAGMLDTSKTAFPNQHCPTSLPAAETTGNKAAHQDFRLPVGCKPFPAEFLSKRAAAKYVALVQKATRHGATVDLIAGQYRRRPEYLLRLGNVTRRLDEVEAASGWLDSLVEGSK